jgi:hypothetical protein
MNSPLDEMVRWIWLLEKTARESSGTTQLRGVICREHLDCILVLRGPRREHVQWKETEPAAVISRLLPGQH